MLGGSRVLARGAVGKGQFSEEFLIVYIWIPKPRMEGVTVLFHLQAFIECLLCCAELSYKRNKTPQSPRGETLGRGSSNDGKEAQALE